MDRVDTKKSKGYIILNVQNCANILYLERILCDDKRFVVMVPLDEGGVDVGRVGPVSCTE